MKLNQIQHRMMINRGLAYVAFKCQKAGHKWAAAMSAMRGALTNLSTPPLIEISGIKRVEAWSSFSIDDAVMNYRTYGDETIIDGDKKEATSIISLDYGCSVINKF